MPTPAPRPTSSSSSSSSTSTQPPSYDQLQTERNLKDNFSKLIKDHEEIQTLFVSVSGQLESTPKIGEGHDLCVEWNGLRKKHRKLYRESQLNASQCASFLDNFSRVLIPLSKSRMTAQEKTFMINKFVETIPVHQKAARKNAEKFHELGKHVEVFPIKVSAYLRNEAEGSGFWYNVWSGVEELCMSIWNALYGLLKAIVNTFKEMLSRVGRIRLSCCLVLEVDVELSEASQSLLPPTRTRKQSTIGQAKEECKDLASNLYGFEDAWHLVRLSCQNLLYNVAMAKSFMTIPPASDTHLKTAEMTYIPLVQCLIAYSRGENTL
ncbi:hypothetical protein ABKN59_009628 [Abortiporus biennis]